MNRRERPHLVFHKDAPAALTNIVEAGGQWRDRSFTLIQPIVGAAT